LRIAFELRQSDCVSANNREYLVRRAIACLQQDHLGRRASGEAEAGKVLVFGEENKSMCLRIFPDESIGRAAKSSRFDVY
jgi:hypothetical protein